MGTNDENRTVNNGNTPLFPALRESRFTPFVCKWRALQAERAWAASRLDCFSKEISEKLAAPFRASLQVGGFTSPFQKSFLRNFIAS
jgi:hypothetical protein